MKILELDGYKYSREQFDDYAYRAKVEIQTFSGRQFILDVYTTNPSWGSVEDVLHGRKSEDVSSLAIINWASKEEDEAALELINLI